MDFHNSHIMIDGQFVSAKVEQIIRSIKDYEPELEVKWLPPRARREGEAAFAIVHNPPGSASYILFYVKDEADFDERVLYRIIYNDQRRTGSQQYSELEAWEQANKVLADRRQQDMIDEANDMAYHVLKSNKNTYVVNDNLVIKDGIPFNAKGLS